MTHSVPRTAALTTLALLAFAGNSILCRAALGTAVIDGISFTALRLVSGAAMLLLLALRKRHRAPAASRPSWRGTAALLVYALPFSLAYLRLDTATGALLLFGGVQLTMLAAALVRGERGSAAEWLALLGAASGVVYLVLPGLSAPDPLGAMLMLIAGSAWGIYSLEGRAAGSPLATTRIHFVRTAVLVLLAIPIAAKSVFIEPTGAVLAITSGAVTSGLGYVVWYAALGGLSRIRAALVQLLVPPLAALGGVLLLSEVLTARLGIASALILGSIAAGITLSGRKLSSPAAAK